LLLKKKKRVLRRFHQESTMAGSILSAILDDLSKLLRILKEAEMEYMRDSARRNRWSTGTAAAVIATSIFGLCSAANASEGLTYGGPRGGTDINGAYLPASSGFYGIALLWGAAPNAYYGNNASPSNTVDLHGKAIVPGLGLLYVYPFKLAGGTLGTDVLAIYAIQRMCVNGTCKTKEQWGDLYSDLIMWSRYFGTKKSPNDLPYGLTVKAAFSMQFPTGTYSATSPTPSSGFNVYRIIPNVALTYLTGPNALGDGVEFSSQIFYGITTTNDATNYSSGDTVDIDFAVSERAGRWQYGLAGYYAFQLQGDKKDGMEVPGGNKLKVLGLGPVVAYRIPAWKSVIKAKLQLPVYARNTAHQVSAVVTLVKAF
jgi:hypothetical protein